jgi:hypothetical protein
MEKIKQDFTKVPVRLTLNILKPHVPGLFCLIDHLNLFKSYGSTVPVKWLLILSSKIRLLLQFGKSQELNSVRQKFTRQMEFPLDFQDVPKFEATK